MADLKFEDIANVSFRKANIGGYKPDEVDSFIDKVVASYENLINEKEELMKKLGVLAQKIEEYREEEDSIRVTLLNAQKMANNSLKDAKNKAEIILKDARTRAEKIIDSAKQSVVEQEKILKDTQDKVINFRSKLISIYKEHLELIDAMPKREDFEDNEEIAEDTKNESIEQVVSKVADEVEEKHDEKEILNNLENSDDSNNYNLGNNENSEKNQDKEDYEDIQTPDEYKEEPTVNFNAVKFGPDYNWDNNDIKRETPKNLFK